MPGVNEEPRAQADGKPESGGGVFHFFYEVLLVMAKSLYVGNLPWSATEEGVRDLFSAHGKVLAVKLISDRETGRARGFGFVEMDDSGAAAAVQALNGKNLGGRALRVNEAQPKAQRPHNS